MAWMMTQLTVIMKRLVRTQPPDVGIIAGVEALFHKAGRISRCFEVAAKRAPRLDRLFTFCNWRVKREWTRSACGRQET